MKKFAPLLFLALTPLAHADVIGIKGDAGVWRADFDGSMAGTELNSLGYGKENNQYVHLYVEHPVPVIPNFRLSYANVNASHSTVAGTTILSSSKVDLTHVDATAYYEILDNWINLDVGASLRKFDGELQLDTEHKDLDKVLPMGYVSAEADLPFTGWSLNAEGNYTNFDDYTVKDYTVKLRYLFDAVLDVGFEVGYRDMKVQIDKSFNADIDVSGPFAGLAFHF